jgi:hypothetical protein
MTEEDEDESPHMDTDNTDEGAQDASLAFDDDLDSDVDDITIEEDDRIFMTMVHPVDPHHFVHASSMVSGHLVEASAKNSKPKGFKDTVLTSLHAYADVFSEMAFDSLPERRCSVRCPSAFNSFELPSWMLYQDVQLLRDSGLVGVKAATRCRVRVQYWRGT